jgi:hypothetical protein
MNGIKRTSIPSAQCGVTTTSLGIISPAECDGDFTQLHIRRYQHSPIVVTFLLPKVFKFEDDIRF